MSVIWDRPLSLALNVCYLGLTPKPLFRVVATCAVTLVAMAEWTGAAEPVPGRNPVVKTGASSPRLWDQESTLWNAARKYQIVRKLAPVFGWEGPRGGRAAIESAGPKFAGPGKEGVNISNERLESSLWGKPERIVMSLGKTDIFNRSGLSVDQGKKPVGQILLLADDFAGAEPPDVSTRIHNGNNIMHVTHGKATADLQVLLTDSETNVIAIKGDYANLTKPVAVRLYRHMDTLKSMPQPQSGNDGTYFWIRQEFNKEKTFPKGFDYCLVAKIAGVRARMENADMQPNLGATVPLRDPTAPGSAATAQLPAGAKQSVVIYVTVVTRAEAEDTLAEAKKRLNAAEAQGYARLLAKNEKWYRALFTRRERGRIFTGNLDDAKDVILPFIYQARYHSRHTYLGNPDPARYEGDANYNTLESDKTLWYGLQCFNEELYTPDFVAGRDETVADYYVKLFNFWRPVWEKNAAAKGYSGLLVLRGYVPPIANDTFVAACRYTYSKSACDWASMIWAFKNVWDAWDYGDHDITFLRDKVYPSLRDIADFFASKLVLGSDGFYHIEPSQIREETIGKDAIDCIASAKWSFRGAMTAARLLNTDAEKCKLWKERLDKVAPYYVIQNPKGESLLASLVVNGKPVISAHGISHFVVNVADEIHLESSEQDKQMAVRSNLCHYDSPMNRQVEYLLGKTPDMIYGSPTYQWIHLFGHPAWMMYYAQKSGVGEFARTGPLQTQAQKTIACWLEPERLCNSRSGTIFFFPCVPGNFDVAFKEFQARGSFLVSGEWKGGAVTHAQITSRRGGPCRVMNPWPGRKLHIYELPDYQPVALSKDEEKHIFASQVGISYALSPQPMVRKK